MDVYFERARREDLQEWGTFGVAALTATMLFMLITLASGVILAMAFLVVAIPTALFESFGVPYQLDVERVVGLLGNIFLLVVVTLLTIASACGVVAHLYRILLKVRRG